SQEMRSDGTVVEDPAKFLADSRPSKNLNSLFTSGTTIAIAWANDRPTLLFNASLLSFLKGDSMKTSRSRLSHAMPFIAGCIVSVRGAVFVWKRFSRVRKQRLRGADFQMRVTARKAEGTLAPG